MQEIYVQSTIDARSYSTLESAIAGAEHHPMQEQARQAGLSLAGAKLISASWGSDSCLISFSNRQGLLVQARNGELAWDVCAEGSAESSPLTYPVRVIRESGSSQIYDPSILIDQILMGNFVKLYVNELGLLMYTMGNQILWFSALRELRTDRDFLYAWLDD